MSRVVLVTGAAGSLGAAVAEHFRANGDRLALLDLAEPAAGTARRGDERFVRADLTDPGRTAAAVAEVVGHFGTVDVLCHLAGGFRMGEPVHAVGDDDWDFLFDLNVRALRHVARAVVPHMLARRAGRIVTVGAASAARGLAGMGAYAASKSATARLTESLSAELREHGINVNCVLPSILDTPANRAAMPQADPARWVAPADLAAVIGFLASDAARAVHGVSLPVSGLTGG